MKFCRNAGAAGDITADFSVVASYWSDTGDIVAEPVAKKTAKKMRCAYSYKIRHCVCKR
jgi:hypothetical protein